MERLGSISHCTTIKGTVVPVHVHIKLLMWEKISVARKTEQFWTTATVKCHAIAIKYIQGMDSTPVEIKIRFISCLTD